MEIIFHGRHDSEQATESLLSIIKLLYERYQVGHFREMHLSMTLVDEQGEDVELVDSETDKALRVFEVYRERQARIKRRSRPKLKLVVNKEL
jgi:hypothetical protein